MTLTPVMGLGDTYGECRGRGCEGREKQLSVS
jgi:hypothetical protein